MPVQTPFGPGLIGEIDDKLWNVVKKLGNDAVTFAEPSIENAFVAGGPGGNLKPTGLLYDADGKILVLPPGGVKFPDGTVISTVKDSLVTSVNTLHGDVVLAAGQNVTITPSGQTLTFAATGGVQLLFSQTVDKTVTASTIPGSLFGTGVGSTTLPAGFFTVGKALRIRVLGYCKSSAASNAILRLIVGGVWISTVTATAFPNTGGVNVTFSIDALITCRTTGSTGTVIGNLMVLQGLPGAGNPQAWNNAVTAVSTLDTTFSNFTDISYTGSVNSATESITTTNVTIEALST